MFAHVPSFVLLHLMQLSSQRAFWMHSNSRDQKDHLPAAFSAKLSQVNEQREPCIFIQSQQYMASLLNSLICFF